MTSMSIVSICGILVCIVVHSKSIDQVFNGSCKWCLDYVVNMHIQQMNEWEKKKCIVWLRACALVELNLYWRERKPLLSHWEWEIKYTSTPCKKKEDF